MGRKVTDLNETILYFSESDIDKWTLREATQGVQIFGSIGSGKSSGSGEMLARAFLSKQFGGIVLTGKVDEAEVWRRYAALEGRTEDLIFFSEEKDYCFNPFQYEMQREDKGGKRTENLVTLFISLVNMGSRLSGGGGGNGDDPFWTLALQRCLKAALDLLHLVGEPITMEKIEHIIRESPVGIDAATVNNIVMKRMDPKDVYDKKDETRKKSYTTRLIYKAYFLKEEKIERANNGELDEKEKRSKVNDERILEITKNYFLVDFANLAERTKSSILEMFYAFANPFRAGLLAKYFSGELSKQIMPEETFRGKIIIVNFPVKEYLELGIYAQMIYKKIWQQAVERRPVDKNTLPVFMWVDEAQYFINEDDMLFQTTARSARACTVMITQNISNYYSTIGGDDPESRVNSLLANLVTKIFHANNDHVTNTWASNTISMDHVSKSQTSIGNSGFSGTQSEALEFQVQPIEFTRLMTGAETNKKRVGAIITSVGRNWSNGKNYLKTFFTQSDQKE